MTEDVSDTPPVAFVDAEIEGLFGAFAPWSLEQRGPGPVMTSRAERGYKLINPQGEFFIFNAHSENEIFWKPELGGLNISVLLKALDRAKPKAQVYKTPLSQRMIDAFKDGEVDQRVIETMTVQRRNVPIIMLHDNGGNYLIDGNHRLKRRILDGCDFVKFYHLGPDVRPAIQVHTYERHGERWERFDPMQSIFPNRLGLGRMKAA